MGVDHDDGFGECECCDEWLGDTPLDVLLRKFATEARLKHLATNLTIAAGPTYAFMAGSDFACVWLTGQHVADGWEPGCGRPAPGWGRR